MGWNSPDVYYQPEKFGLSIVFSENQGGPYEFDLVVVWQHDDGSFYVGMDAGCSCPSPFEDVTTLEGLEHFTDEHSVYSYLKDISSNRSQFKGVHTRFNRSIDSMVKW